MDITTKPGNIIIAGDLNVHFYDSCSPVTKDIISVLQICDLEQHIKVTTHNKGHTLDVLITRSNDNN